MRRFFILQPYKAEVPGSRAFSHITLAVMAVSKKLHLPIDDQNLHIQKDVNTPQ